VGTDSIWLRSPLEELEEAKKKLIEERINMSSPQK